MEQTASKTVTFDAPAMVIDGVAPCRLGIKVLPREVTVSGWLSAIGEIDVDPPLNGEINCDWAIIGGGWTGTSAARRIAELRPDDSIVLVDAGIIGNNAGGRCAGFAIDLAHNPRKRNFAEDKKSNFEERQINVEGIAYLKDAVERFEIACDWSEEGKTHASVTASGEACLASFAKALDELNEPYSWYDAEQMKEMVGTGYYTKGLHTPSTVLMQPAALLRGLTKNIGTNATVYENTPVIEVIYGGERHILTTDEGQVRTRNILLCNNGFLTEFGFFTGCAIPIYTYGSLTRRLTEDELKAIGGRKTWGLIPADSFGSTVRKTADDRLLIRNIYGYARDFHTTNEVVERARRKHQMSFDRRFPKISKIGFEYSWGGALSLAQNSGQVFGELRERVWAAGFCNGTGVSKGAIFGKSLAELAHGTPGAASAIISSRQMPNKPLPQWIMALGVRLTTEYRLWRAGMEV